MVVETRLQIATVCSSVLPETVWDRHSNPKSGWSRLLSYPVLIVALYARNWRLLGATCVFLLINPILFPAPESDSKAWMSRVVRAEQEWTDAGNPLVGLGFPQVLNLVQIPVFCYNVYAAYRRYPFRTAVFTVATMILKLWFVAELVERSSPAET
ncbi:DUF6653 family protein [Natronorubrum texcoconense]|uniref:Uncharacterized protein n=1 Tax=Natronorubrum texcoconense TaxID=1095776 RepID=A0A1G8T2U2_9EURY|nr:DUF6653 family protein [Natronorubrum texcoconense]SDJ35858.1 hypothetical protein SAMN04515672_0301 [Natronorubrum texcoconense]